MIVSLYDSMRKVYSTIVYVTAIVIHANYSVNGSRRGVAYWPIYISTISLLVRSTNHLQQDQLTSLTISP